MRKSLRRRKKNRNIEIELASPRSNINQTMDPSLGDQIISDPELVNSIPENIEKDPFDEKGYGILNPFQKFNKKSDEPVDFQLIRNTSHE